VNNVRSETSQLRLGATTRAIAAVAAALVACSTADNDENANLSRMDLSLRQYLSLRWYRTVTYRNVPNGATNANRQKK
jgi:hypothetical protein